MKASLTCPISSLLVSIGGASAAMSTSWPARSRSTRLGRRSLASSRADRRSAPSCRTSPRPIQNETRIETMMASSPRPPTRKSLRKVALATGCAAVVSAVAACVLAFDSPAETAPTARFQDGSGTGGTRPGWLSAMTLFSSAARAADACGLTSLR